MADRLSPIEMQEFIRTYDVEEHSVQRADEYAPSGGVVHRWLDLIHTQNLPPSAFLSDTNPFFQR
jgi:hypothetical protein